MGAQQTERIPTNLRVMLMLEVIGRSTDPMTAAEIGREVGLPKQTIHRLCDTLVQEGFLVRDQGGFRPGRRARGMASGLLHASTSNIARHQILERLAAETGETVNFVVPEDKGMSYKDRVETNWPFRVQLPIGSHVPFHCTASGKTFLASLPRSKCRRTVAALSLTPETDYTITTAEALLAELSDIKRSGYALDNSEFIEGMAAIAVPVHDKDGRYIAAIGVHGPSQRFSTEKAAGLAPMLNEAAKNMAEVLFST